MKRREFIQTTAGVASGLLLLKSDQAFGYPANSAVRLGLLGCGGRGTHVATSFSQNTAAQVAALADLFQNQLGRSPRALQSGECQPRPPAHRQQAPVSRPARV